jgi:hypothetical protein
MKKINLIFFAIFLLSNLASAQPTVSWVKNYELFTDSIYTVSGAEIDNLSNIIVAGYKIHNSSTKGDPLVIKYNSLGNEVFTWTNPDSIYDEWINDLSLDSTGNIYILSIGQTKNLIKISPTGQELFNITLTDTALGGTIAISQQFIYVAYGFPNSKLRKYDLQGNLIWSIILSGFFRIEKIHVLQNQLYLIGDSVLSPFNWKQLVKIYDDTGFFQSSTSSNVNEPFYYDSEFDISGDLWITGFNASWEGYLTAIGNGNIVFDTLIGGFGVSRLLQNANNMYWLYVKSTSTGKTSEIVKFSNFSGTGFAVVDSIVTVGNGYYGADLAIGNNNEIIVLNTRRGSLSFNPDYELTAFDTSGNLIWDFVYTNDSLTKEEAFKVFIDNGSAYIVGNYRDSQNSLNPINIVKLDLPTGINEVIPSYGELNVFPNPMSGKELNFDTVLENINISLVDIFGRTVEKFENFSGNRISLPRKISPGFYTVVMENETTRVVRKIIVN